MIGSDRRRNGFVLLFFSLRVRRSETLTCRHARVLLESSDCIAVSGLVGRREQPHPVGRLGRLSLGGVRFGAAVRLLHVLHHLAERVPPAPARLAASLLPLARPALP